MWLLALAVLALALLVPAAQAAPEPRQGLGNPCEVVPDEAQPFLPPLNPCGPISPANPDSPTNPGNVARGAAREVIEELITPGGEGEVTEETITWLVTAPNLGEEDDAASPGQGQRGQGAGDSRRGDEGTASGSVDPGAGGFQLAAPTDPDTQAQADRGWLNPSGGANLNGLRERVTAIALALLGATMTFGIIHFWLTGLSASGGGGSELGDGLLRAVGALLAIMLWPVAFDYVVVLQRIVSDAVLDGSATAFIASSLTGLIGATALTGPGVALVIAFLLAIGSFLMLLGLLIMKIVMNAVLALLFVAMPLVLALFPLPTTAWITRLATRAFTVVVLAPLIWALCFATMTAVADDIIGPSGFMPGNILLMIALLYVCWALPWKLMSVVGLGLPFEGATGLFAKFGGMMMMFNGLTSLAKKFNIGGEEKGGKSGKDEGQTGNAEGQPAKSPLNIDDDAGGAFSGTPWSGGPEDEASENEGASAEPAVAGQQAGQAGGQQAGAQAAGQQGATGAAAAAGPHGAAVAAGLTAAQAVQQGGQQAQQGGQQAQQGGQQAQQGGQQAQQGGQQAQQGGQQAQQAQQGSASAGKPQSAFDIAMDQAGRREGSVFLADGAQSWNQLEPQQQRELVAKQQVEREDDKGNRVKGWTRGYLAEMSTHTELPDNQRRAYADLAAMTVEERADVIPEPENLPADGKSFTWDDQDIAAFERYDRDNFINASDAENAEHGVEDCEIDASPGSATPPSSGAGPSPAGPPQNGGDPGPATPPKVGGPANTP